MPNAYNMVGGGNTLAKPYPEPVRPQGAPPGVEYSNFGWADWANRQRQPQVPLPPTGTIQNWWQQQHFGGSPAPGPMPYPIDPNGGTPRQPVATQPAPGPLPPNVNPYARFAPTAGMLPPMNAYAQFPGGPRFL